ncbi:MAG: aspartate/tyrosine/aromatic [Desulfobulbaceae bacterium]|nr:MAG: aspartate/tyrosine/aromatic [Desulfobulbaceae bacterium]
MSISDKMRAFAEKSSWIRKMFEEGAKMKAQFGAENVFDFSLGNPDVPPPPEFTTVLIELAADETPGTHAYMPNGGYPWVRDILASKLSTEQGVTIQGNDLLMTCGAAGAINIVMKSLLNPGDEVLLLAPYFVEYNFYVDNHGGVSKVVATDQEFNLDLGAIEAAITSTTKAVLINSPNNPTGQVYSQEDLNKLGKLLDEAGKRLGTTIYLIADEPYRNIVFDNHQVGSAFLATKNSIVLSSYSKALSLPGERIGYVAVHPEITDKTALLGALTLANRILGFVNAPALMQRVVARLQEASVDNSIYSRRRDLFCSILKDAGYEFMAPKGAFYIFPKSPIADDVAFCAILQEHKILAVPGCGFGAPGYFRLAFCISDDVIGRSAEAFQKAIAQARG